MKKILFMVCTLTLLLVFLSCSKTDSVISYNDNNTEEYDSEQETQEIIESGYDTEELISSPPPVQQPQLIDLELDDNPYTAHYDFGDEVYCECDYSEVYETLDLSQYSNWGNFGEDGIMWVEKSDYTGKQFGYIDYHGNVIIPFSETIKVAGNFEKGLAVISYDEWSGAPSALIDTKGNILAEFIKYNVTKIRHLSNGNVFLDSICLSENTDSRTYMYSKSANKLIQMPIPAWQSASSIDYSDGLLLIYSDFYENPGTKYFDADGNCVIDLDNSNEYYQSIRYAERFYDGQATVTFVGKDGNYYNVDIDKTGAWITEPERISESDANWFSYGY